MTLIEDHTERFGVEPICRVLTEHGVKVAPSTYYAARNRPHSARALRDAEVLVEIKWVYSGRQLGRGVYGARKVWHQLLRDGLNVPRCQVERLTRAKGVRRGRRFVTTRPDTAVRWAAQLFTRHDEVDRRHAGMPAWGEFGLARELVRTGRWPAPMLRWGGRSRRRPRRCCSCSDNRLDHRRIQHRR